MKNNQINKHFTCIRTPTYSHCVTTTALRRPQFSIFVFIQFMIAMRLMTLATTTLNIRNSCELCPLVCVRACFASTINLDISIQWLFGPFGLYSHSHTSVYTKKLTLEKKLIEKWIECDSVEKRKRKNGKECHWDTVNQVIICHLYGVSIYESI